MDPQEAKTDSFELPPPTAGAGAEVTQSAPEQGPMPEQQAAPAASAPSDATFTAAPPAADPAAVQGPAAPLSSSASTQASGLAAEDADLIEKTWVEKAKQIVAETRGDPYSQNKEINKVKADYIKKRYNKDIKLASE